MSKVVKSLLSELGLDRVPDVIFYRVDPGSFMGIFFDDPEVCREYKMLRIPPGLVAFLNSNMFDNIYLQIVEFFSAKNLDGSAGPGDISPKNHER